MFNVDNLPVIISVNDKDYVFFKDRIKIKDYTLIKDSDIYNTINYDGWRYQQIIKMNFYRLNFSEYYLSLDSDSFFIRNFTLSDFVIDNIPKLVKHNSEFFLKSIYNLGLDTDNLFYKKSLEAVKQLMQSSDSEIFDYGPSPYLWDTKIWKLFFEDYLMNETIEAFFYKLDAIYMPSENAIYGEYVNKILHKNYIASKEFFMVYHFKEQFDSESNKSIKFLKRKYANDYLGIIIQSNFFTNNKISSKFLQIKTKIFKITC